MVKKSSKKSSVTNTGYNVVSKLGDIWLLNQHRLMCGDSTQPDQVKQLMPAEKADMAFIDPPYNVGYQGRRTRREKINNDNLGRAPFTQFLHQLIAAHQLVLKRGASLYICHSSHYQALFQQVLEQQQFEIRSQIVWAKNHFVISFARYKYQHEVIFYCHYKNERDPWYGDKKQSTLWQVPKPITSAWHPTMKPVELIEKALLNSSKKEDIIVDLCGGAGSTLMACERQGRYARLLEIEPRYVDATIQRWQWLTKQPAILAASQVSYDELLAQSQANARANPTDAER